jgi:glycosyltransferase involved in cell wall biosynthesis
VKPNRGVKSVLFCSAVSPSLELGAGRAVMELADAMRELGLRCDLIGPRDLCVGHGRSKGPQKSYADGLRTYLKENAGRYDVVEYPHNRLPYGRTEFARGALFVARSVLLRHHFSPSPFPLPWRHRIGMYLRGRTPSSEAEKGIALADATIREADLVNVSNFRDRSALIAAGVPPGKIIVMPFGMSLLRRNALALRPRSVAGDPVVLFIGRFNRRKGAADIPAIAAGISRGIPRACFRLLGTGFSGRSVLASFPATLANRVDVVESYFSAELPSLLEGCSVGIMPSYVEGFPFALLEMLAAAIPVIAYDAPGASMMLEERYLVPRGDSAAMAGRVVSLLASPEKHAEAAAKAVDVSRFFAWERIAAETADIYERRVRVLREGLSA